MSSRSATLIRLCLPHAAAAGQDRRRFAVETLPIAPIVQHIIEIIVRLSLFLNHHSDFMSKCRPLFGRELAHLRAQFR